MKPTIWITTIILSLLVSGQTIAQNHDEHKEHNGDHHHDFHKHHIALFNGATTNFDHDATDYTVGIDYEFRFCQKFGAGIVGEYVATDSGEWIFGVPVFYHPCGGLKLFAAPLAVFAEEHHDNGHNTNHDSKKEASFSFRIGAAYDFHFGKFSVGPSIDYDMGDTKAFVYGLALGIGF